MFLNGTCPAHVRLGHRTERVNVWTLWIFVSYFTVKGRTVCMNFRTFFKPDERKIKKKDFA